MSKIVKYVKHYVVHFKNEEKFKPVEISEEWWKVLMQKLLTDDFVMINWEFHNKYNINYIKPYDIDFETHKRKQAASKAKEDRLQRLAHYKKTWEILT